MKQSPHNPSGNILLRRGVVAGLAIWIVSVIAVDVNSGRTPATGSDGHVAMGDNLKPPKLPRGNDANNQGSHSVRISPIRISFNKGDPEEDDSRYPPVGLHGIEQLPSTGGGFDLNVDSDADRSGGQKNADGSVDPKTTAGRTLRNEFGPVFPGVPAIPLPLVEGQRSSTNHSNEYGESAVDRNAGENGIMHQRHHRSAGGVDLMDGSNIDAATDVALWWEALLAESVLEGRSGYSLSLEQALGLALSEAPELQVLQSDWFIQRKEVSRVAASFDWVTFVEAVWNRDSTPVGSDLDGATDRLRSRSANSSAGIRRLTRDGSEVELSQEFGTLGSNSRFINPNNQGTSRLFLDYERPLLRGAGEDINTSNLQLAGVDKEIAFDRFQAGVQDHLLQVATAYWSLVLRRGQYLQEVRSWQRATAIAEEMEQRIAIDVTPGMLQRAKSEVAQRLSESIDAEHNILRAQDSLLRLIYGSRFTEFAECEVLTSSLPMRLSDTVEPGPQVERAMRMRSEVHRSVREMKAASIRYNVASNQLLPVLNLVLTGYVAGLRGNNDIGGAFLNQFSEGEPGVGVGFNFEIPYRNRAAKAEAEQAQIAIRRMQAQFEATVGLIAEDVRGQVIQRNKFGAVLSHQKEALDRARQILIFTKRRRELLADGNNVADLYLENLLQMQGRLQNAELTYLRSQVQYSLADNALLRSVSALDTIAIHAPEQSEQPAKTTPTPTGHGHSF